MMVLPLAGRVGEPSTSRQRIWQISRRQPSIVTPDDRGAIDWRRSTSDMICLSHSAAPQARSKTMGRRKVKDWGGNEKCDDDNEDKVEGWTVTCVCVCVCVTGDVVCALMWLTLSVVVLPSSVALSLSLSL